MESGLFEMRQLMSSLPRHRQRIEAFLRIVDLAMTEFDYYIGLFSGDELVAGGGCCGNVIQCVAVHPDWQQYGLSARVISHLRTHLRAEGHSQCFIFTKPDNRRAFGELSFTVIGEAEQAILLDSDRRGVAKFCAAHLPDGVTPGAGAVVLNANPFTNGHLHLVEYAAARCPLLHLFVVREERSAFSFAARRQLVAEGCAHLPNVRVHDGGPYIISAATFPSYFLKRMDDVVRAHTEIDLDVFARHIAPAFGIVTRFVGEEPHDPVTATYNDTMAQLLPAHGVAVEKITRHERHGRPISASRVRALLREGDLSALAVLVPPTTLRYIEAHRGDIAL